MGEVNVIVHTMNNNDPKKESGHNEIPAYQLDQFKALVAKLFQCCQERMQYQYDRFQLPDAELRCLVLFSDVRYLTATDIALKMNVVKSRVSKIVDGLLKKRFIQRIKDPEDSRISLLSLTPQGQKKINEINMFLQDVHYQMLLQLTPEERKTVLANLNVLRSSMEAVKELMV